MRRRKARPAGSRRSPRNALIQIAVTARGSFGQRRKLMLELGA